MRFVSRAIQPAVLEASRSFPALVMTGPRRAGKTTLLRRLFPRASYVVLEDPDVKARARADPRGLLESIQPPALFDEIQNVPELFPYIRTAIDRNPSKRGQWLITGSQEAPLMEGVSESMAGRAAILQLLPLSLAETPKVSVRMGGYPESLARPRTRDLWFGSYIQTYLERDVRAIVNIRDLATFRRFLALLASRHGQILNRTDLAAPLGVSVPTIGEWLRVLEITGQIILVPPYFENFGKRLVRSPKIYVADSGLACHLLGVQSQAELDRSPFRGVLFEGFVASEIVKQQVNRGRRKELYYFRDQQGLEVDFLFPAVTGELWVVECKATKTPLPSMARPVEALLRSTGARSTLRAAMVHQKSATAATAGTLVPGIAALDIETFVREIAGKPRRKAD